MSENNEDKTGVGAAIEGVLEAMRTIEEEGDAIIPQSKLEAVFYQLETLQIIYEASNLETPEGTAFTSKEAVKETVADALQTMKDFREELIQKDYWWLANNLTNEAAKLEDALRSEGLLPDRYVSVLDEDELGEEIWDEDGLEEGEVGVTEKVARRLKEALAEMLKDKNRPQKGR